jgi:hypothetical protein
MNKAKDKDVIPALVRAGEEGGPSPEFPYSSAYDLHQLLGIFQTKPSQVTSLDWNGVCTENDRQQRKLQWAEDHALGEREHSVMQRVGPTKRWMHTTGARYFEAASKNSASAQTLDDLSRAIEDAIRSIGATCSPTQVRESLKCSGIRVGISKAAFRKRVREAKARLSKT